MITAARVLAGDRCLLAHVRQVLGGDVQCPLLACFVHGGAVVGVDELVEELLAGVAEELGLLAHRCPSRYVLYVASAAGMASAYHSFHRPDLSPATSRTVGEGPQVGGPVPGGRHFLPGSIVIVGSSKALRRWDLLF